jgi:hypothetical protein
MRNKSRVTIIILLMLASTAYSATYYINGASGNDGNPGTIGSPWQTIHKANITLVAGDTVYIRGSVAGQTYNIGNLGAIDEGINPVNTGADKDHRITYAVYPGEKVTFYGSTWNAVAIHIADKNWIKVTGYDGATSAMNLKCISFDQGFLLIQSEHKVMGVWDGTGGSNYNEISYCEFAFDKYRTYTDWQPNHAYSVGDMVVPLAKKNYRRYICVTGGTSGGAEPDWKDAQGLTTSDNNVVWGERLAGMSYRGSTIYCSSSYNWIHHCSFHDFGFYGLTYDGGALFEIGYDQCGEFSDCLDTTNSNVVENCSFYHGGHHTFGLMTHFNVIRNNVLHNEQYFSRGGDGVWHSYRNFMIAGSIGPYSGSNNGYNLLEGNRTSHASENMNNSNGGTEFFSMQSNDIIRYNDVYAAGTHAFCTPLHIYTEEKYSKFYNNTMFSNGYGATFPDIVTPPVITSHTRRAVFLYPGWQGQEWDKHYGLTFKNNLFWKNYEDGSSSDMFQSNYGPNWDFNCDGSVCADIVFDHNFNSTGTKVDPKFTNEGSYGSPHIHTTNIEWYWPITPDGSDITTLNTEPNFNLQASSPAINQGTYLTQANGSGSNSTTLIVDDAKYFQPGWGNGAGGDASVQADSIAIGTVSNTVQISLINYDTKTITLASPMTWADDAPVWLYKNSSGQVVLHGSAPDCGAHEYVPSAVQTISLSPGWNWVSFNVLPADLSLNSVFNGMLDKIEQVKSQTQSAMRSSGNWKGDLVNLAGVGQYKMFKVKVNQACTLAVSGTAISPITPIHLQTGWNWVAYLPTTSIPIATALASISGQVQEIKSLTQSATYSGGTWSGTLTQLEPGQGYAIKMSGPGTLTYPAAAQIVKIKEIK